MISGRTGCRTRGSSVTRGELTTEMRGTSVIRPICGVMRTYSVDAMLLSADWNRDVLNLTLLYGCDVHHWRLTGV